jgi:hypothetical protein
VLLVDTREAASPVTQRFGSITLLSERAVPAGLGAPRRVRLFALANFKPK